MRPTIQWCLHSTTPGHPSEGSNDIIPQTTGPSRPIEIHRTAHKPPYHQAVICLLFLLATPGPTVSTFFPSKLKPPLMQSNAQHMGQMETLPGPCIQSPSVTLLYWTPLFPLPLWPVIPLFSHSSDQPLTHGLDRDAVWPTCAVFHHHITILDLFTGRYPCQTTSSLPLTHPPCSFLCLLRPRTPQQWLQDSFQPFSKSPSPSMFFAIPHPILVSRFPPIHKFLSGKTKSHSSMP